MQCRIAIITVGLLTLLPGCDSSTIPQPSKVSSTVEKVVAPQPELVDPSAPLHWSSSKYFKLHEDLLSPNPNLWHSAVSALEQHGDRFTVAMIAQRHELRTEKQAALEALSAAIRTKFAALHPAEVQVLLERDIYSDLRCPTIEFALRKWTRDYLSSQMHRPEIRKELARLQKTYDCRILVFEYFVGGRSEFQFDDKEAKQQMQELKEAMEERMKDRTESLLQSSVPSPNL